MAKSERSRRSVVDAAWLEWTVTRQAATGRCHFIVDFVALPGWFCGHELGLAITDGPSILWTLTHLPEINRAHLAVLACRDLPKPKRTRKQVVAEARRREWRALIRFRAMEKDVARRGQVARRATSKRSLAA
jgi:hypothetical protein